MTNILDASIGIKEESVFGTAVTVDRFPEFISESMQFKNTYAQSEGKRVGARMKRASGRVLEKVDAGGQIALEAVTQGLGVWLEAALGTKTVIETPDTGVYLQVHTPADTGPAKSYTIQKGLPPVGGGAVQAYTFPGSVCEQLEIDFSSPIVKLALEWISREVVTGEAYASPSYVVGAEPLTFVGGEIYIGATVTKPTDTTLATTADDPVAFIKGGKVTLKNNLDGQGFNLGGAGKRTRTSERGMIDASGSLDIELQGTTMRDALLNQTRLSLLLNFEHPTTIGTSSKPTLQVYIPAIAFNDSLPQDGNGAPIVTSMNFEALNLLTASTSPVYVCYQSTDTAV